MIPNLIVHYFKDINYFSFTLETLHVYIIFNFQLDLLESPNSSEAGHEVLFDRPIQAEHFESRSSQVPIITAKLDYFTVQSNSI